MSKEQAKLLLELITAMIEEKLDDGSSSDEGLHSAIKVMDLRKEFLETFDED